MPARSGVDYEKIGGRGGPLRSLARKLGINMDTAGFQRMKVPVAVVFALLGILVVVTFFLYMSKLSSSANNRYVDENAGEGYAQSNSVLPAPENIKVTVEKGATVRWDIEEDVRIIGYNVYRFKAGDDPGSKVNAAIISDTVYHDDEGSMFNSYAVAPVDNKGREGVVSIPVVAVAEPVSLTGLTPTREPEKIENVTFTTPPEQTLPATIVDCTAEGTSYFGVWYLEHYGEVTGGTIMVTPYYGDSCSYTFTGDSIAVISTRHWNYGIMDVYLDGELRQQVDLYSTEILAKDAVFTASGLGPGAHTIRLVCTGRKNPNANFTFINVEAFQVK